MPRREYGAAQPWTDDVVPARATQSVHRTRNSIWGVCHPAASIGDFSGGARAGSGVGDSAGGAEHIDKRAAPDGLPWTLPGRPVLAILNGCQEDSLSVVAQRLKATVSGSGIQWWGDRLGLAVSIGWTGVIPGDTVDAMVERAESALKKLAQSEGGTGSGGA